MGNRSRNTLNKKQKVRKERMNGRRKDESTTPSAAKLPNGKSLSETLGDRSGYSPRRCDFVHRFRDFPGSDPGNKVGSGQRHQRQPVLLTPRFPSSSAVGVCLCTATVSAFALKKRRGREGGFQNHHKRREPITGNLRDTAPGGKREGSFC